MNVEVLRNDLGAANEVVASILLDGKEIGQQAGAACRQDPTSP